MDDELNLRELIEIIWTEKKIVVIITLAVMLFSCFFIFFYSDPIYQAKAVIAINQTSAGSADKTQSQGLEGLVDSMSRIPRVNALSYASQAKTSMVIQKVMERVGITPEEIPISIFSKKIDVINIKDTELLEITAVDKDPKIAANIANSLAEELVEFVSNMSQKRTIETLAFLEKQVSDEKAKVEDSVKNLKEFLKRPNSVAELQKELDNSLSQLSILQDRKVDLELQYKKITAGIAADEKQLKSIPMKIQLKQNLFDNPVLYQSLAENKGTTLTSISNLELTSEVVSQVYIGLKTDLEINKSILEQVVAEKSAVEQEKLRISETIKELQVELADKETKLKQLELDRDMANENYILFNKKYAEAKIAESIRTGDSTLIIVSPAHEPVIPVGPKKMLNLAIATILGLTLSVVCVVIKTQKNSKIIG